MGPVQNYVSIPRRPPDVEDYIEMLRRYRSWIIAPMFLGLVVSVVVGFLWPDTYVSQATLRIVPQQVPTSLVPAAMSMQIAERVNQMKQEILSRTGLEEIIRKPALNLYPKQIKRLPMEDIVQDMRNKYIIIDPVSDPNNRNSKYSSAFRIQFSYTDRYKAQAVVRELVNRFMESNIQVQKQQATTTTDFLNNEVKLAKQKMDEADAAITRFVMSNQGKLPQQEASNGQALSTLQLQLMNVQANMGRTQQDKTMLETQLDNNRAELSTAQSALEEYIPGTTPASVRNESLVNIQKDIGDAQAQLSLLSKKFGRNHPDVAAQQEIVAALERKRVDLEMADLTRPAPTPGQTAPIRVVNQAVQQRIEALKANQKVLQAQIAGKQQDIDASLKEQQRIQQQMAAYQQRLEQGPLNAQQYAALLSDASIKKQDYEEKVKKANLSATVQNLEDRKAGESLEQLDPPSVPEQPSEPDRLVWALVGTAGGLVIGLLLSAAQEIKDTSLKNLKDVRTYTNLPVLSSIPLLENALLVRRKRRLGWAAWSCSIVVGFGLMGSAMYYHFTNL